MVFTCWIPAFHGKCLIEILVEGMGRVNYGPYLADRKGIQRVRLGMQLLFGWEVYTLPMENLSQLSFVPEGADGRPGFRKGTFSARTDADCFVDMKGFEKRNRARQRRQHRPLLEPWPTAHALFTSAVFKGEE